MTYNPNIPNPGDLLSNSQGQIKTNFSQANTIFGINHYPFDNGTTNKGKHKFVEMVNQGADPAGAAGEGTIYTKTAVPGSNIYYKDDASNVWQLTRVVDANAATFGLSNNGWSFLPGGLIIKYGYITNVSDSGFTTYTLAGPAFTTQPLAVSLTIASTQILNKGIPIWKNSTFTTIDIAISNGNSNRDVSYIVIGL